MVNAVAIHIPSPTNPRISLHQEYAMRTEGYDEKARLTAVAGTPVGREIPSGERDTTFHALVEALGIDEAIRAVSRCAWMSSDDFKDAEPRPCTECAEVAHA